MKKMTFVIAALILFSFDKHELRAQTISFGIFYNSLAPYGEWVAVETYGMCWRPEGVPPGWRPYVFGHWVWTPYGWTWVSNDPCGWAVYHYGRWFYDPYYGWLWVPGYVWAPAWVQWRWGDGFVGWAPLPPGIHFELGITVTGRDDDFGVGLEAWNFIRLNDITATRYTLLDGRAVPRVFGETRNVTQIRFSNDGVHNIGVSREEVERITRTRIHTVDLMRSNQLTHERLDGGKLIVYSPAPLQPRIRNEQIEIRRQNEFIHREGVGSNGHAGTAKPQIYPHRERVNGTQMMVIPPLRQTRTEYSRTRSRGGQTPVLKGEQKKDEMKRERDRH